MHPEREREKERERERGREGGRERERESEREREEIMKSETSPVLTSTMEGEYSRMRWSVSGTVSKRCTRGPGSRDSSSTRSIRCHLQIFAAAIFVSPVKQEETVRSIKAISNE